MLTCVCGIKLPTHHCSFVRGLAHGGLAHGGLAHGAPTGRMAVGASLRCTWQLTVLCKAASLVA